MNSLRFGSFVIESSPWVEGKTLRDAIAAGISREAGIAALIEGIACLAPLLDQEPAICHGDLSPANLVLAADGRVDWIDWECAKIATPATGANAEWIFAKPAYLAPERARSGMPSRASEIFSLGAIAFELIVGRPLFSPDDAGYLGALHFNLEAWTRSCFVLPNIWRAAIAQALHPSPGLRQATALELAVQLERAGAQR